MTMLSKVLGSLKNTIEFSPRKNWDSLSVAQQLIAKIALIVFTTISISYILYKKLSKKVTHSENSTSQPIEANTKSLPLPNTELKAYKESMEGLISERLELNIGEGQQFLDCLRNKLESSTLSSDENHYINNCEKFRKKYPVAYFQNNSKTNPELMEYVTKTEKTDPWPAIAMLRDSHKQAQTKKQNLFLDREEDLFESKPQTETQAQSELPKNSENTSVTTHDLAAITDKDIPFLEEQQESTPKGAKSTEPKEALVEKQPQTDKQPQSELPKDIEDTSLKTKKVSVPQISEIEQFKKEFEILANEGQELNIGSNDQLLLTLKDKLIKSTLTDKENQFIDNCEKFRKKYPGGFFSKNTGKLADLKKPPIEKWAFVAKLRASYTPKLTPVQEYRKNLDILFNEEKELNLGEGNAFVKILKNKFKNNTLSSKENQYIDNCENFKMKYPPHLFLYSTEGLDLELEKKCSWSIVAFLRDDYIKDLAYEEAKKAKASAN
ncbi:MAG: hypothetical protein H0W88_06670 [Parachlamydiaceae bacterium]|nr:hypothetical protein [Parachlamydiaceae bacterium]